jgi:hypothetical protein
MSDDVPPPHSSMRALILLRSPSPPSKKYLRQRKTRRSVSATRSTLAESQGCR